MLALERRLVARYFRFRHKDSFISVITGFALAGITLGVATLIVVMSVMNGFRAELMDRILGMNGHLSVFYTPDTPDTQLSRHHQLAQAISTLDSVAQAFPVIEKQAMIMLRDVAQGALVHGITPDALHDRPFLQQALRAAPDAPFEGMHIIVGHKLLRKLGCCIGDRVTLAAPKGVRSALGMLPRMQRFQIVGSLDAGMNEYDANLVLMPLKTAQMFFSLSTHVSCIEIFLKHPDHLSQAKEHLKPLLTTHALQLMDWQQANARFFSVIQVEQNVMFLILSLIVLVAAFNIVASLVMLVKDKAMDIGILRTMGATRGQIYRVFVCLGMLLGLLGTALGVALGTGLAYHLEPIRQTLEHLFGLTLFPSEFYFLSQLPSQVNLWEVFWIAALTILLTFLATLYPAARATMLQPKQTMTAL